MKLKTSELTHDTLLWAVATCEGYTDLHKIEGRWPHEPHLAMMPPRREYGAMELWEIGSDNDWRFFGPIIERECIELTLNTDTTGGKWRAGNYTGPTPLVAAMRCYVASKMGDELDVPGELLGDDEPPEPEFSEPRGKLLRDYTIDDFNPKMKHWSDT